MKTTARTSRRRHELLREFFACAVVIAAIKSGQPASPDQDKPVASPSPGLI